MAQAVSRRPLTAKARASPSGICGGQSGIGTGFFSKFNEELHNLYSSPDIIRHVKSRRIR
jgi:hypothetical protein